MAFIMDSTPLASLRIQVSMTIMMIGKIKMVQLVKIMCEFALKSMEENVKIMKSPAIVWTIHNFLNCTISKCLL